MPLKKSVIDIPFGQGLKQKYDARRLPIGATEKAVNLLVDKVGHGTKRLGLYPLPSADPADGGVTFNQGVALGTNGGNLLIVGRGTVGGVTTTQLKSYSDALGGPVCKGPVPDVKIVEDTLLCNTPNCATSMCCATSGDITVFAWIDTGTNSSLAPYRGQIVWCAIERSTGTLVAPPGIVPNSISTSGAQNLRLTVVGTTFVLCHDTQGTPETIGCVTQTLAQLQAGQGWFPSGAIVTKNITLHGAFDMRNAGGDATYFLLAWQVDAGVGSGPIPGAVKVEQRLASAPGTVHATWTAETSPGETCISYGLRADQTTSNRLVLAYAIATATPYEWQIKAASALYPSMANSKGTSVIYTSFTPTSIEEEWYPSWLAVTFGGPGGTTSGTPTWTISHSPWCSVWNALRDGSGAAGSYVAPGLVVSSALSGLPAKSDARIVQNMVYEGASTMLGWAYTSGGLGDATANACITAGVVLASQGCEANGIAYFLGWVPSASQGSFLILAQDGAQNPVPGVNLGPAMRMRPVGTLQTRTALCAPGTGPSSFNSSPGPNSWTGGADWQVIGGDHYGTAVAAYIGSSQGQRMQPAYGLIETAPTTGYPMVEWGNLTAIGGALPGVYDRHNYLEQGYLYVPEGIFAIVDPATGGPTDGPTWTNPTDAVSWIFTWEQFDQEGNFHISARGGFDAETGAVLTITGAQLVASGTITLPYTPQTSTPIQFQIPSLGPTMRQWGTTAGMAYTLVSIPPGQLSLGVYRTSVNGSIYYRTIDRFFNRSDINFPNFPANSTTATSITYSDTVTDAEILDGSHPELYGDGTPGTSGGAIDRFNPPASNIMVRHKERLFVAAVSGNVVRYTDQLSELVGPGYDDIVKAFTVGGADPVVAMESLDDKVVALKADEVFYVPGDGPATDGSGQLLGPAQPIPTDLGCAQPVAISGPEGVYYMSSGGLRVVTRANAVEYAGGPVEDEFNVSVGGYPYLLGATYYPQNNRILFLAGRLDYASGGPGTQLFGEVVLRDYVLDAWTTMVVTNGDLQVGFVSAAVATALGGLNAFPIVPYRKPTLHLLGADGTVWREHFPNDSNAYYDNATYVSSTWLTPPITCPGEAQGAPASMQGRFRLWDILAAMVSNDPHGLVIGVATDYGALAQNRTWAWASGPSQIAPGGTLPTPITQVRTYHGRMGEAFQIQIQDTVDAASATGQGPTFLGLTCSIGTYPGPYKLPPSSTQ